MSDFISDDMRAMLAHFSAPQAESVATINPGRDGKRDEQERFRRMFGGNRKDRLRVYASADKRSERP